MNEALRLSNSLRSAAKRSSQLTNYTVNQRTGCWEFNDTCDKDGYGKIKRYGKDLRAHRVSYAEANGVELTPDVKVLHSCDNPPCINPAHLSSGTTLDNERDKDRKGRRPIPATCWMSNVVPRGEDSHLSKLREEDAIYIKGSTKLNRELADLFDISMSTVQRIKKGTIWSHLKGTGKSLLAEGICNKLIESDMPHAAGFKIPLNDIMEGVLK